MLQLGQKSQIARALGAVGKKNVGSEASAAATIKTQRVAMGKIRANVSNAATSSHSPAAIRRSAIHPGSSAGYEHYKSAWLTPENTGYLNPRAQKARYNRSSIGLKLPSSSSTIFGGVESKRKLFDYRYTNKQTGSIAKLNKLMK